MWLKCGLSHNCVPSKGGCGNPVGRTRMALAWLWAPRSGTPAYPGCQLEHGVRIINMLPSPRVEHCLCITMEQYLLTTITWSTESYFWRRWWFDQWWTSFFSRFGNLHRRSKQPKTWDDCLCFRCQGSSLCWRCFTAHLELWTLWQSSSKQGKFWWETLQLLSDLYQTMFRVFPLVVCMKPNSETTTTKYYGR